MSYYNEACEILKRELDKMDVFAGNVTYLDISEISKTNPKYNICITGGLAITGVVKNNGNTVDGLYEIRPYYEVCDFAFAGEITVVDEDLNVIEKIEWIKPIF